MKVLNKAHHDFMKKYIPIFLAIIISGFFVAPTFAREDYFKPTIGEVRSDLAGFERAVSLNTGKLTLYGENGKLVKNFPISISGRIVASSPIFSDVTGDGTREIVVVTRTSGGSYFLNVYSGTGAFIAEAAIASEVYYDPVELRVAGSTGRDILVTTVSGLVLQYHYQSGSLVASTILTLGKTTAVTSDSTGQELDLIFPQTKQLAVYNKVGAVWTLTKTNTLTNAIIYPVTRMATSTLVYGVTANSQLIAIDTGTGLMPIGFPVALPAIPLDSPMLGEIDSSQAGSEIIVPVAGGNNILVSAQGVILNKKFATRSLLEKGTGSIDTGHTGLYSAVRNYASSIVQKSTKQVASIFGLKSFAVMNSNVIDNTDGVIIANAEDSLPGRFTLLYPSPAVTSSVKIVADDAVHGNAYEFKVSSGNWFLSISPDVSAPNWDINTNPVFQWEMATTNTAMFLLTMNTNQGWKYLYYRVQNTVVDGQTIYSPDHQDGAWHTYSVNLAQDIAARFPGAVPNGIVSFRLTGNGRLDNVRLLKTANLATISGTAIDDQGAVVPAATLTFKPLGQIVVTDAAGKFVLPSLPAGAYSVSVVKPFFAPMSSDVITINPTDTAVNSIVHLGSIDTLTIANAANNDSARFTLLYPTAGVTSSIQTVVDPQQGKAYEYSVSHGNWFYSIAQDSIVPSWDVSNNRTTLAWESKIGSDNNFLITVQTDAGSRYLYYSTGHTPHTVSNVGFFQLASNLADGQWHTISRDIKKDLATYFPEVTAIKWIISYRLTGHGRLNNLRLIKSTP